MPAYSVVDNPKIDSGKAAQDENRQAMEGLYQQMQPCFTDDEKINAESEEADQIWKWIAAYPERAQSILYTKFTSVDELGKKLPVIHVQW